MLPNDLKPVTSWLNRDEAFENVVKGMSKTIKDWLSSLKTKDEWLDEGTFLSSLKRYGEALVSFEQAIRLDPNFAPTYYNKRLVNLAIQVRVYY